MRRPAGFFGVAAGGFAGAGARRVLGEVRRHLRGVPRRARARASQALAALDGVLRVVREPRHGEAARRESPRRCSVRGLRVEHHRQRRERGSPERSRGSQVQGAELGRVVRRDRVLPGRRGLLLGSEFGEAGGDDARWGDGRGSATNERDFVDSDAGRGRRATRGVPDSPGRKGHAGDAPDRVTRGSVRATSTREGRAPQSSGSQMPRRFPTVAVGWFTRTNQNTHRERQPCCRAPRAGKTAIRPRRRRETKGEALVVHESFRGIAA